MKYLRKIFESNEYDKKYIEECFFDILENPNFEVDDLLEFEGLATFGIEGYLKLHIELGKSLIIQATSYDKGMVEVDLEILRNKNKAMLDLFDDIEVAVARIKDRLKNARIKVKTNTKQEIDILIYL